MWNFMNYEWSRTLMFENFHREFANYSTVVPAGWTKVFGFNFLLQLFMILQWFRTWVSKLIVDSWCSVSVMFLWRKENFIISSTLKVVYNQQTSSCSFCTASLNSWCVLWFLFKIRRKHLWNVFRFSSVSCLSFCCSLSFLMNFSSLSTLAKSLTVIFLFVVVCFIMSFRHEICKQKKGRTN